MKFLKVLLTIVLVLVGVFLVVSLFLPSEFDVHRKIVIQSDAEKIYNDLANFENWEDWDPWQKMDSLIIVQYQGTPASLGHKSSWTSDVIGSGSQTLSKLEPYTILESDLYFKEYDTHNTGYFNLIPTDEGTEVTWGFRGENPFLMRIMGLFYDAMVGPSFDDGLSGLKKRIESMKTLPDIMEEEMEAIHYLSIKSKCNVEHIADTLGMLYGQLLQAITENNTEMIGMPLCFYHTWDYKVTDLEAAVRVEEGNYKISSPINYGTLEAGNSVTATFFGPYHEVGQVHEAIETYMMEKGLESRGPAIEIYQNDPESVSSPDELETKIIYPVN